MLFDADQQGYPYVKRFCLERTPQTRPQSFVGENANSRFVLLTDQVYPRLLVTFGGADSFREPMEVDVEQFIAVKGFKAKGKRLTTFSVDKIEELEPTRFPDAASADAEDDPDADDDVSTDASTEEEGTPKLSLFED